ncbi:Scr1 family TA system antitoxin-like transcriptional regulator [Amycolatopsis sp. NPDC059021]|uniref:Scr1 family TA system antitoxin-like transcriptional regulator n=1 Tax=Amycolatopsis sp. NPDC059021 TaxID=3346704 RepID=UPI00366CAB87
MGQQPATPAAIALGVGLRIAREHRGFGVRAMAAALGIAPAVVSLMELAVRPPTVELTSRVLGFLAVRGDDYRRLLNLARHVKDPNWTEPGPCEYPAPLLEYERTATTILAWAPKILPDIVQTPDYARAVLDSGILTGDEIGQELMLRLVRQDALSGDTPATLTIMLAEAALAHQVGGPAVWREQLRHLLTLIDTDQVAVRIVPADPHRRPGLLSPFSLLRFSRGSPVVTVCRDHIYTYLTESSYVDRYVNIAERLTQRALRERNSRAHISEALATLDKTRQHHHAAPTG